MFRSMLAVGCPHLALLKFLKALDKQQRTVSSWLCVFGLCRVSDLHAAHVSGSAPLVKAPACLFNVQIA